MLLPISVMAYFSIVPYSQALEEQIMAGNLATAKEVSYLVEEHFNWSIKVGNYFGSTPRLVYSVENRDIGGVTERLALLLASVPDIDRAYITTPEGILWVDYPPNPEVWGKNKSHRDWYKGVSRGWQPCVSELYMRETLEPRYVVSVAIPVRNESRVIGIVVMQHRLETIQKWVAPVRLGKSGIIYIVDKNGRIVAHPREDPRQPPDYSSIPIVGKVLLGGEGVEEVYSPFENEMMLSAYVPVKGMGMGVIAQQPTEEAFSPVTLHKNLSLIIILLTGIFAALVASEYDRNRKLYRRLTVQHEELKRRTGELSALYKVSKTVSQSLDLNKLLNSTLETVLQIMGADGGGINLIEDNGTILHLKVHKGLSKKFVEAVKTIKIDFGASGQAVELKKSVAVDVSQYPVTSLIPMLQEEGVSSIASAPIIFKDRTLGTINIHYKMPHTFSQDELDIFASISSELGVAIENARLFSELQRRIQTIECLYDIDKVVSKSLVLEETLKSALTKAIEVIGADSGSIHLLDEKGDLVLKIQKGLSQEFASAINKIKMGEGVTGMAAIMQKPESLDIARYPSYELLPHLEKEGIVSLASTPLIAKGRVLGAMTFSNRKPRIFSKDDLDLLVSIGSQIGVAIENARLFSELQRHDKTLEALYAIDRVVSQTLELESLFKNALSKALEVTETEAGGIYLLEEETLSLKTHSGLSPELVEAVSKLKVGQGVSGMAVKLEKPVAMDIAGYPSPELLAPLIKDGIVFIASAPLIAKGKVLGAITLADKGYRSFSPEYLDLLASIGSQIGAAIQNARLFNELERSHKTLEALYTIESVVSRSLNLEEIFKVALSKVLEVTGTETGTLYSFDGEVLHLEAFEGLSPEFIERAVIRKMGEGIPGIAAQLKKAITMDISQFPSSNLLSYVKKEGLVSFIGTPLLSKGKVVGALALGRKKKQAFTPGDLDLLFSIGNAIGVAAENARLYRESKENLQKLQSAYEELQTLDKMKDEFISNVSHELKTPLISIKGYGELLYDEKLDGLSDKQKKSLEAIIRNADRLTRLINSILFISKLQAGKVEFKFEPLDVDEIVSMCAGDFKSMMDKKQIIFKKEIPEISRIKGDRDRFIEVINNLLDNAVKFTQEGGKISIRAWDDGEFVHLTVSDTGIGIPSDVIPKLFTRFYQLDASTARKYGGTGLGLYITKNIIDAFNGKIWIESEVGKGTTVHVLLPVAKESGKIK